MQTARAIIRAHKRSISVLCPLGHVIDSIETGHGSGYAGSFDAAQLGLHAAGCPNIFDRRAEECSGFGHSPEEV